MEKTSRPDGNQTLLIFSPMFAAFMTICKS